MTYVIINELNCTKYQKFRKAITIFQETNKTTVNN